MPQMVCYRQSYEAISQSVSHGGPVLTKYLYHVLQWLSLLHYLVPNTETLYQGARGERKTLLLFPLYWFHRGEELSNSFNASGRCELFQTLCCNNLH